MIEYLLKAFGAWFLGFFPLAEIYVAVPAAMASGLGNISVIWWTVLGNYTPILLITWLYDWLIQNERINRWFEGLISEKVKVHVNRWGIWFVLFGTPWTGVWVMAVTIKTLGMNNQRFLLTSFISILVHAIAILYLIQAGVSIFV